MNLKILVVLGCLYWDFKLGTWSS